MGNKLVTVSGLCGSGKSEFSKELARRGFSFVRFGQITLDIAMERDDVSEAMQQKIRQEIRNKYGMGGYAVLNIPKFDEFLKKGHIVGDNMTSWSEYKILREKYGGDLIAVTVHTTPQTRYTRVSKRRPGKNDKELRNHSFTKDEAYLRDCDEIENCEKGGPIAMADWHVINEGSKDDLIKEVDRFLRHFGLL
ncbi:AAA family ATPase [Candidatus Woesearchaeota archaeon]|nr:AAA family ATPase [Candidatus Woesearchaeota archaeon]